MPLVKTGTAEPAIVEDGFVYLGDDEALPDTGGGVIVSLARFQKDREALLARNAAIGVRLKSDQSPQALGDDVSRFSVIVLEFPKFRDGRAFSWARMLRSRLGYTGEVRAVGDYLYDQIAFMRRVGFNAFELTGGLTLEHFNRALGEMSMVYQPSADGRKTIRDLRAAR